MGPLLGWYKDTSFLPFLCVYKLILSSSSTLNCLIRFYLRTFLSPRPISIVVHFHFSQFTTHIFEDEILFFQQEVGEKSIPGFSPSFDLALTPTQQVQGSRRGIPCQGTYYVSHSTAKTVVQRHRYEIKLQDDAKLRTKKVAEIDEQMNAIAKLDEKARRQAPEDLAPYYEERKIKNVSSTGSRADDLNSSTYLARRAAQQRRPTDTKPTNFITKQLHRAFPPPNQVYYPTLYPPAVNNYYRVPVDLDQSPQMAPRFHGSKSTTEYLSYEYNSSQHHHAETQVGKPLSRF